MIHTIYVDASSELTPLKKEFRKCLMTGGAVVRLSSELRIEELETLVARFSDNVQPHSLQAMVLEEVAKLQALPAELEAQLRALAIPSISRALTEHE